VRRLIPCQEDNNQLVGVEDQGQTATRGLLLRPSRRQSENEKRGVDEEDDATIDLNRRIAEVVERAAAIEAENEVLRSRVEAAEAGLCQLYSRSITATTVGERRRLELSAAYEEAQELARVVPDMCKHIIEFAKCTEAFCLATQNFYDMDVALHETPAWDYGRADQASVGTERLLKVKYFVRMYNDSSGLCAEDVKYIYHVFIYIYISV
jgi:hypothetical protein